MGTFYLQPQSVKYYAEVIHNGKKITVQLPPVEKSGFVIEVDQHFDGVQVQVRKNSLEKTNVLAVTTACRGRINSFATVDLSSKNKISVKIPYENLKTGVNEVIVYDTLGRILSERLFFINRNDAELFINTDQKHKIYKPFEKVNMEFSVSGLDGNPVETAISISVKDSKTNFTTTYRDNILTAMLLSSDIKGYVENPYYYFVEGDENRKTDLDLLMLTQGWRRYVWEEMAGLREFKFDQDAEKGILVDGTVKSLVRDKLRENVDLSAMLTNDEQGVLYESAITDREGKFAFYLPDIWGDWDMVLQTKENNKKKDYRILLNRLFSPVPLVFPGYKTELKSRQIWNSRQVEKETIHETASLVDTISLEMHEREHILPTVTITNKKHSDNDDRQEHLSFADVIYNVGKSVDAMSDAGDYLGDNVIEFLLKTNKNFLYYYSADRQKAYYLTQPVEFLINGTTLGRTTWASIEDVPLSMVDTIAITDSRRLAARLTIGGEMDLSISGLVPVTDIFETHNGSTTRLLPTINDPIEHTSKLKDRVFIILYMNPDNRQKVENKSIRTTKLEGYSYTKEFYSPGYEYLLLPEEKDYRRTIYWNPNLQTDTDGKATVTFYNNGSATHFDIDAETLNNSGKFGVYEQ